MNIGSAGEGAAGGSSAAGGREKDAAGPLKPVTLEQVLMHNFHDNRVEGLRRTVSGQKGGEVSWCLSGAEGIDAVTTSWLDRTCVGPIPRVFGSMLVQKHSPRSAT